MFVTESENENAATQEKQISRELRLLTSKLGQFRVKQAAALKERRILREQLKKRQKEMREEKKKYKLLQKEVDKMAKLMKEADDDEYEPEDPILEEEEEVIIIFLPYTNINEILPFLFNFFISQLNKIIFTSPHPSPPTKKKTTYCLFYTFGHFIKSIIWQLHNFFQLTGK